MVRGWDGPPHLCSASSYLVTHTPLHSEVVTELICGPSEFQSSWVGAQRLAHCVLADGCHCCGPSIWYVTLSLSLISTNIQKCFDTYTEAIHQKEIKIIWNLQSVVLVATLSNEL